MAVIFLMGVIAWVSWINSRPNTLIIGNNVLQVEIVSAPKERARGLSGREGLSPNSGMYFIYPKAGKYSFWMKHMRFPIDIVWIKGNKVVGVTKNIPAPSPGTSLSQLPVYFPPQPVDRVLEISAGAAARYHIKIGDEVRIN